LDVTEHNYIHHTRSKLLFGGIAQRLQNENKTCLVTANFNAQIQFLHLGQTTDLS